MYLVHILGMDPNVIPCPIAIEPFKCSKHRSSLLLSSSSLFGDANMYANPDMGGYAAPAKGYGKGWQSQGY
eukprot:12409498-Karenia_brevis.AAC.1